MCFFLYIVRTAYEQEDRHGASDGLFIKIRLLEYGWIKYSFDVTVLLIFGLDLRDAKTIFYSMVYLCDKCVKSYRMVCTNAVKLATD